MYNETMYSDSAQIELNDSLVELATASGMFSFGSSAEGLPGLTFEQLLKYLRNPLQNINSIRRTSKYMTNKHGIVKDTLRTLKSHPTLYFFLSPNDIAIENPEQAQKTAEKIYDFLETIDVKKMVRDGIYEAAEAGTVVLCNRQNQFIQFLDFDQIKIDKRRGGDWIVEFDLATIPTSSNFQETQAAINAAPDEVTIASFIKYKKDREKYRYVEIPSAHPIALDANRNSPYGLPFTLPAWSAIIQKDLISKAERNIVDRLVKQILVLSAGNIGDKPPPKDMIEKQFQAVKRVVESKSASARSGVAGDSGVGVIAFSDIFNLSSLQVDTTFIPKDMYIKLDDEIYSNLGMSKAMNYGGGSDYSSAQMNQEKVAKYINSILEQFQYVINKFIKSLLGKTESGFEFRFDLSASTNTKETIANKEKLFLQTGVLFPWAEAVTGQDYRYLVAMKHYQDKILKSENLFAPPQNAYTSSATDSQPGRPEDNNPTNANTNKSKSNGSNNNPSPSDG
ncbi:hypothetical protein [Bacillus sp. Marseille-P3800]|uniref:hypothetical protein n=1 Tax=Bacillus sp. Marseille-P3800 TaxID=2014782 RepID=UPI000C075D2F|nr:hypothetical protein [Bacillus sp. Marseille-P3800]